MPTFMSASLTQMDSRFEIQMSDPPMQLAISCAGTLTLSSSLISTMLGVYLSCKCFQASATLPFLYLSLLQPQIDWKESLPSPLDVSMERNNSLNANLFFLWISNFSFSASFVMLNF